MFSALSSKIFAGTTTFLLLALIVLKVTTSVQINTRDKALKEQREQIAAMQVVINTLKANADTLEFGLKQCNDSARAAAETADRIARAGVNAVEQVRRAGAASTASAVARLEALPRDGATPADLCAQADAILLEGAQ